MRDFDVVRIVVGPVGGDETVLGGIENVEHSVVHGEAGSEDGPDDDLVLREVYFGDAEWGLDVAGGVV